MDRDRSEDHQDLYRDREQTYVKHVILQKYLERFAHIIGSWADTITYVDGFSGPWQTRSQDFRDTSFGIAIEELRKARQHLLDALNKQVLLRCFFVETGPESFRKLQTFRQSIADIEIEIANTEFETAIPKICSFIKHPGGKKFAFILVDPKGWDGFSMSAMVDLLRLPNIEVLVNFMTSFIKRFLDSPDELTQQQLEALFGDGTFRNVIKGLTGLEREYAAVDAYASNLGRAGNFAYVCKALVLNPEFDKTHYHLIYATRDPKGVEVFKQAELKAMKEMNLVRAKVNQRRREEKTHQQELFQTPVLDASSHYDELRGFFLNKARAETWKLIFDKELIAYDALWKLALQFPVVWESDLRGWLSEWISEGKIELLDLKLRERVPKVRAGHRVRRK